MRNSTQDLPFAPVNDHGQRLFDSIRFDQYSNRVSFPRAFSNASRCCAQTFCTSSTAVAFALANAAASSKYSPAAPLMLRWTTDGVYFGRGGTLPRERSETRTSFLKEATTMAFSACDVRLVFDWCSISVFN